MKEDSLTPNFWIINLVLLNFKNKKKLDLASNRYAWGPASIERLFNVYRLYMYRLYMYRICSIHTRKMFQTFRWSWRWISLFFLQIVTTCVSHNLLSLYLIDNLVPFLIHFLLFPSSQCRRCFHANLILQTFFHSFVVVAVL